MKLSEILLMGKARIQTLGWCQGDDNAIGHDGTKGCCAATAIPLDSTSQVSFDEVMMALDFLKKVGGFDMQLAIWNDHPSRTVEDVYALYDKAIAAAEAQEQAS